MSQKGRYFSPRDQILIRSLNDELVDNIIQTTVLIYKISPTNTSVNIYGETKSSNIKLYNRGIPINCHVDTGELTTSPDDFIDKKQNTTFKFLYHKLKELNFYLQEGDLVEFNSRLYQIDEVAGQEQLLGGIPDKSFSIICNTHYSRLSVNDLRFVDQQ